MAKRIQHNTETESRSSKIVADSCCADGGVFMVAFKAAEGLKMDDWGSERPGTRIKYYRRIQWTRGHN